jgi:hypothetical protein
MKLTGQPTQASGNRFAPEPTATFATPQAHGFPSSGFPFLFFPYFIFHFPNHLDIIPAHYECCHKGV